MALIDCPECGTRVSDQAESCPDCAPPIAGRKSTQTNHEMVQTIEETSKVLKLQKLLALALVGFSFLVVIGSFRGRYRCRKLPVSCKKSERTKGSRSIHQSVRVIRTYRFRG